MRRGSRLLVLLAFWLTGCGPADPLQVRSIQAVMIPSAALNGWGSVLRMEIRLENKGDAPVHVFTDLIHLRAEDGTRGSVREFVDRYRMRQARAGGDGERRQFEAMFAKLRIGDREVRQLAQAQIEVPPGGSLTRVLPVVLSGPGSSSRFDLELAYHDDATDRINKLRLAVDAK